MTDLITKRFARFKQVLIVCCCFWGLQTLAAQPDSSLLPFAAPRSLPEITIRDTRFDRTGYAIWQADSLPLQGPVSLAERLRWENRLDVRAQAPGTLATISIRGAGPTRTPIFWNGLNLQSPMNGVMDASLLPLWPEDELSIYYGGQSAALSSGAMGGTVVVSPRTPDWETGFSGNAGASIGSFGRKQGQASLGWGAARWSHTTRASWQAAKNDFPFQKKGLDGRFYETQQVNNNAQNIDFQQFNAVKINTNNTLKSAYWHQRVFRELPPTLTESARKTWQSDRSHRGVLTWESAPKSSVMWTTRAAWLDDFLAYHLEGDTDTSHSRQFLLSTERSVSQGRHWAWRTGAQYLRQSAQVDGYSDSTQWFAQTRLAAFAMGEWHRKNARISALIRQEWAEDQAAPFTGTLGGQISAGRWGDARFHASRNFTLPTLNDRFWRNLGKPDLNPEKGFSGDFGWEKNWSNLLLQASAFHLLLDDWILWQPDASGLFRPNNLRKVWSRGLELDLKWQWMGEALPQQRPWLRRLNPHLTPRWALQFSANAQTSRTTNQAVYGGSEAVLGKQLPYTPRFSAGANARLQRGAFSLAYLHQFTGTRLDNTGNALPGFQLGSLLASFACFNQRLRLDFRGENIGNTRYEILRNRPMPGRNWSVGLGWQW